MPACYQSISGNNEIAHTRAQYSEILRKVGRLEEALASYEEAIELHPDEQGLRCGRAAVLTDLYRFPEALKAYDEVIRDFPSEVVPLAGRALCSKRSRPIRSVPSRV